MQYADCHVLVRKIFPVPTVFDDSSGIQPASQPAENEFCKVCPDPQVWVVATTVKGAGSNPTKIISMEGTAFWPWQILDWKSADPSTKKGWKSDAGIVCRLVGEDRQPANLGEQSYISDPEVAGTFRRTLNSSFSAVSKPIFFGTSVGSWPHADYAERLIINQFQTHSNQSIGHQSTRLKSINQSKPILRVDRRQSLESS